MIGRALLCASLLSGCAERVLPGDLPDEPLGACLLPVPAWTEAEAAAALDLDELSLDVTVTAVGVGPTPSPCWQEGGFSLWLPEEVEPDAALWARLEDADGGQWMLAIDAPGVSLPSGGTLSIRHRVNFPAGRDEIPRGHLVVQDATGVVVWGARHLDPDAATVPEGFSWDDGGEVATYASSCGDWSDRSQRVGTPDGEATLERAETALVGPWTVASGGYAALDGGAAFGCQEHLGAFGAEVFVARGAGR